jgi:HK97 family phage major capsid protein/HK97 family phage prohead protease
MDKKIEHRNLLIKNIDEEEKSVILSFASSEPYERWWGVEILRISQDAIDFSRLEKSAPLLFNHDTNIAIGVVEKAWIEGNKAKAKVRFGNSQKAKEIFEDVKAGILKNVSVGYEIQEMKLKEEKDDKEFYEVTKWLPLEISIVTIPADNSVGIGRDKQLKGDKMPQTKIKEIEVKAKEEERKRVSEITAIAQKFNKSNLAKEAIEAGISVDEFRAKILDEISVTPQIDTKNAFIGMSEKEVKEFSLLRALRALANPYDKKAQDEAKFEFEVSKEAQKKSGLSAQGILVPLDVMSRALTVGGNGSNVVSEDLLASNFIELLRNKSALIDLVTTLSGLNGNVAIPRQVGAVTVNEVGETEALSDSDITLDQLTLTPKRLGATTSYSKQLLNQSSLDVENLIRNDLLAQISLKIDAIAINTILNETGVGLVAIGDDGGEPKWQHFVGLESEVAIDNADVEGMRYIINAKTQGYCKTTPKVDGYPSYIIDSNQINGYGFRVSNQVPSNLTKGNGSDLSAVLFGNFSDIILGLWGGVDIVVDPYSKKKQGLIEITADQFYDIGLRHPQSFAVIKDAKV